MSKINLSGLISLMILQVGFGCHEKMDRNKKQVDKSISKAFQNGTRNYDTVLLVLMNLKETELIEPVHNKITSFYHLPVKIIQSSLPEASYYKERNRYRADSLINYLSALNKSHYRFVAGITSKDISTTNGKISDWGVFGLGSLSGKGCITSTYRLKKNVSVSLLTERIQKVILHEIGHNYGLEHCTSAYPCFMKAANGSIKEVDSEPMNMCKVCRLKIHF